METFDIKTLVNIILYVATKMRSCDIYKLCKTLYFADKEHLSMVGWSLTGDEYNALPYGPVPSKTYNLIKEVRDRKGLYDKALIDFVYVDDNRIVPLREPDLDYISELGVEVLDKSIAYCEPMSFADLKEVSHDIAWRRGRERNFSEITKYDIMEEGGATPDLIAFTKEQDDVMLKHKQLAHEFSQR